MTEIRIPPDWQLDPRLTTPERVFLDRRQVLTALGLGTVALGCGGVAGRVAAADRERLLDPAVGARFADRFPAARNAAFGLGDRPLTAEEVAAAHNNFYEFTTDKGKVWELAQEYSVESWKIEVGGMVQKPTTLDLDDLFTRFPLEERLYRFRCVERWAMQVPWTGFPLARLIESLEPLSAARYVRFVSFEERDKLPGQSSQPWYPWPYFEGLRMDEAMHPLAFVVVGSYGHALPMQHGAPWRLALPWKYGYKGPKSVVRIEFTDRAPETFWHKAAPTEYGFYSNVRPDKPHPRWSQAQEQDIGTGDVRPTLPYNGYQEQVAGLYDGKEF